MRFLVFLLVSCFLFSVSAAADYDSTARTRVVSTTCETVVVVFHPRFSDVMSVDEWVAEANASTSVKVVEHGDCFSGRDRLRSDGAEAVAKVSSSPVLIDTWIHRTKVNKCVTAVTTTKLYAQFNYGTQKYDYFAESETELLHSPQCLTPDA